ncbi:MAG: TetR/AcrR family transcriptional regulator [Tannerella sp.]|jgi:AcrR family transcriptional regulator|nr:TetR/AcrR family transcriptional regulator [Tannerella sp.]
MPRTKEQNEQIRREKRELIKQTALRLFAAKGYASTSISEIAEDANIAKGLLYNYYESKEALLQTIWDELIETFKNLIDPNHDGEVSDEEAENFVDALFELLKNNRDQMKLYYQCSFQPEVVEFLMKKFHLEKAARLQAMICNYFGSRLPFPSPAVGYFTVLVFLKGLSMVVTYTENVHTNGFLDEYKVHLKRILFNGITKNNEI